jgi:hypothetical protein
MRTLQVLNWGQCKWAKEPAMISGAGTVTPPLLLQEPSLTIAPFAAQDSCRHQAAKEAAQFSLKHG